jgi:hypothetical protein
LAPAGCRGKAKKAATNPNALRRVKLCSLSVMWILRVEAEVAYRHPTLAQLFAASSPILREQLHSSPSANLESYLAGFSFRGLDRQRDCGIGRNRPLRFTFQAVLA